MGGIKQSCFGGIASAENETEGGVDRRVAPAYDTRPEAIVLLGGKGTGDIDSGRDRIRYRQTKNCGDKRSYSPNNSIIHGIPLGIEAFFTPTPMLSQA